MAKKFKDIVKQNPEPARGRVGTDPLNPWSAKANLAEAGGSLERYLLSRGINPKFVSKDTKISHAKSSVFQKWKQDHKFEEVELNEDAWLDKFLSSRGINPNFVTKDVKISYAKSGAFEKWKRDHIREEFQAEEADKEDVLSFDIPLFIRILELAREDVKEDMELHRITERLLSIRKKGILTMDDYDFIAGLKKLKEELEELAENMEEACWTGYKMVGMKNKGGKKVPNCVSEEEVEKNNLWNKLAQSQSEYLRVQQLKINESKQTALQRFRAVADEREKKHNEIEKNRQEKLHQDPTKVNIPEPKMNDGMSAAIARLEKHLNKEEVKEAKTIQGTALDKFRQAAAERARKHDAFERAMKARHAAGKEDMKGSIDRLQAQLNKEESDVGISKTKETSFHKKLDTLVHKTFGKRKDELKMKEEVEQIDEISKSTLASYKDKSSASMKNAQTNRDAAEPGKNMSKGFADLHTKSDAIVKKRVKGLIGYMQRKQGMKPTSENMLDPQAATEAPVDGANNSDVAPSRKSQLSKSARMIKSIYKKHNVKEDMTDWEKEDKSVQTYGKKPKLSQPDEKTNFGENKPSARIVMSGGTTLTGEKRDTIVVDPLMKSRPGPDTFGATGKKASQQ